MCQKAGGEGCAANSPEHSTPVGNRVLVTGVDPCEGRKRVGEAGSQQQQGLGAAGALQGALLQGRVALQKDHVG